MAVASHAGLPYGRFVSRLLRPLHGAFLRVNRMFVPALDAGLSPLFSNPATGYLMVLRTVVAGAASSGRRRSDT